MNHPTPEPWPKLPGDAGRRKGGNGLAAKWRGAVPNTQWPGYVLAVIATLATLYARVAMNAWFGDRPVLVLFLLPVILSAFVGGIGPGLLASALAAVGTAYFVMPPVYSFAFERPVDCAQWVVLILSCVLLSVLTESLHRMRAGAGVRTGFHSHSVQTERKVRAGFAFALVCLGVIGVISFLSVPRQITQTNKTI